MPRQVHTARQYSLHTGERKQVHDIRGRLAYEFYRVGDQFVEKRHDNPTISTKVTRHAGYHKKFQSLTKV